MALNVKQVGADVQRWTINLFVSMVLCRIPIKRN